MQRPQEGHADIGLVDDDNTPDMRTVPAESRCANTGWGPSLPINSAEPKGPIIVTPSTDTAQSWRDLAEQLTPEQIADVTLADEAYRLRYALRLCQLNKARATLADLELPPDATSEVSEWEEWDPDNGIYHRSYTAWAHPTLDVYVFGTQDSTGSVTRRIVCSLEEFTADQARDLAAALHQAAYELERWQ